MLGLVVNMTGHAVICDFESIKGIDCSHQNQNLTVETAESWDT